MKCCVSADVGTWTNWLTFEPDPNYSPDAETGLLSPISYALQHGILLRRENPTYRYWAPVAAARRGFKMVSFTASRGNTFVGGKCALPSALLVRITCCQHVDSVCLADVNNARAVADDGTRSTTTPIKAAARTRIIADAHSLGRQTRCLEIFVSLRYPLTHVTCRIVPARHGDWTTPTPPPSFLPHVGRLRSGSRLLGRIGSGIRVSASFKKNSLLGSVAKRGLPPRGFFRGGGAFTSYRQRRTCA